MNVDELNNEELEELRSRYINELIDIGEESIETISQITFDDVRAHYDNIYFVKEDFFCNI